MEEWREIYNNPQYKISSHGNVISNKKSGEWKAIKLSTDRYGYYYATISYGNKRIKKKAHQLVAESFLGHRPDGTTKLVVNHIDYNKTNNNINNLEIVTVRENSNRKHLPSKSKYVGVGFKNNKWCARIQINGKRVHLGYFVEEYDAHIAYQNKLKEIK